jgi:hypothetical protein
MVDSDELYSHFAGRISAWDVGDEDILAEDANQRLKRPMEQRALVVTERIVFEEAAAHWLTSLVSEGVTESLVHELKEATSEIRYQLEHAS